MPASFNVDTTIYKKYVDALGIRSRGMGGNPTTGAEENLSLRTPSTAPCGTSTL